MSAFKRKTEAIMGRRSVKAKRQLPPQAMIVQAAARRRRPVARTEKKFYDTALAATAVVVATDAAGAELDPSATSMISTPAQGDGEQNRDGKRITIESVYVTGIVDRPRQELSADTLNTSRVFVALVLDTQSNGAQMNSEDCYKNTGATSLLSVVPQRNLAFGSRFKVLKTGEFDLTPNTLSHFAVDSFSSNGVGAPFEWYHKFKEPLVVNFNTVTPTVNTILSVVDNSLHMIAYATASGVTLSYNARIRFFG